MHEPPENDKGYVFVEVYVYESKPHAHPVGKVCGLMHGLATGFYFYRALHESRHNARAQAKGQFTRHMAQPRFKPCRQ